MYRVAETFLTLQGEGHWTGRVAVFCRFAGCNLWTGKEADRHRAVCRFCDTDFSEQEAYGTAIELAERIKSLWPGGLENRMVVLTGGEPTLQVDRKLLIELHRRHFYVAVETNGTRKLPDAIDGQVFDWVCVSPKAGTVQRVQRADELKVVWPQPGLDLDRLADFPATHYWLSPMDVGHLIDIEEGDLLTEENTQAVIDYCLKHPQWRLNVQTHKKIGIR